MSICSMCNKEESVFKDERGVKFKGKVSFSSYCRECANAGVEFGFLEKENLVRIE